jgi:hypothetical protein
LLKLILIFYFIINIRILYSCIVLKYYSLEWLYMWTIFRVWRYYIALLMINSSDKMTKQLYLTLKIKFYIIFINYITINLCLQELARPPPSLSGSCSASTPGPASARPWSWPPRESWPSRSWRWPPRLGTSWASRYTDVLEVG